MGKIIGIDLGTTNSLAAVWEDGQSRLIPNALGEFMTPSVVSFDEQGNVFVGRAAKERLISHPGQTISLFKRDMGTSKIYRAAGKEYRPEELSALILRRLKEDAEVYLGEPVEEAVVSVPAYFNDMARKATRDAGRLAGMKIERIINEPSAAALACRNLNHQKEAVLLVFDFGGGTLDVSLVDCFDNVIEIVAVSGDNHLGGSDFDRVIAEHFCGEFGMKYESLPGEMQETILLGAETLKRKLTESETGSMTVVYGEFCGSLELTRKELIQLSGGLFQRMAAPVKRVLRDGQVTAEEISQVVLAGGSCRMPVVQQYIRYLLKNAGIAALDPDYLVALGVGVYVGIKARDGDVRDVLLTDICPFSLGTGIFNQSEPDRPFMEVLIERNTALPASRQERFVTVADFQKNISLKVYQGEEMYAKNNLFLGEISTAVTPAPKGKESILVRYTYDINGILVVDLTVESTGEKKQLVLTSGGNTIPEEELNRHLKELEKLKISPRDQEENRLLMERGQRLYIQLCGQIREDVGERMKYFEYLLETADGHKLRRWKRYLETYLNQVEATFLMDPLLSGEGWQEDDWWKDEEDEDTRGDYTDWSQGKYLN